MRIEHEKGKPKFMITCQLCMKDMQHGPELYEDYYLKHYDLTLCKICYDGCWDGIAPTYEEKFIKHLEDKKIELPKRNQKGWFPRGDI